MSRRFLIAGNWKLNLNLAEAKALATGLREANTDAVDVLMAPVATALTTVKAAIDGTGLLLSAQNCHFEDRGAFTGELSPELIADVGCTHCIIGHSERREIFGETDAMIAKKTKALLGKGLIPIVCIGETLEAREAGKTLDVVLGQVDAAFEGLEDLGETVVAYEPIWAIGTGKTATPEDAQAVHAAIRERIATRFGSPVAQKLRILYGGSVKPTNASSLLAQPDIDGALVGGASLKAETFLPIVSAAEAIPTPG